jgi:antirestriction protein ArdC
MMPTNVFSDAFYRGINVLTLWVDAIKKGYPFGYWASYQQWQQIGGQVRYGEKGSLIIFYKSISGDGEGQDDGGERPQFVARASRVFNAAQVDGWSAPLPALLTSFQRDKKVEGFVSATHARVEHGFSNACYRRDLDAIQMPSAEQFLDTDTSSAKEAYYSTLLHELTHWSGAGPRLNREFGKRFGDNAYAFEELVAELGAAFLCATLGIANEPRIDHAQYLSGWLKVLEQDHKAIFTAAGQAQKAVEYVAHLVLDDHQDRPQ